MLGFVFRTRNIVLDKKVASVSCWSWIELNVRLQLVGHSVQWSKQIERKDNISRTTSQKNEAECRTVIKLKSDIFII